MKKKVKIPVRIALGSVILLTVFWLIWNLLAVRELERLARDLRDAGVSTSFEELLPQAVPDGENAASLYRKAYEGVTAVLSNNIRWIRFVDLPNVTNDERSRLRVLAEPLNLVSLAATLPKCSFIDKEDLLNDDMWYVTRVYSLSRLIGARAVVRIESGEIPGAIEDLKAYFAICYAFGKQPDALSQLQRLRIAKSGFEILKELLPYCKNTKRTLDYINPDNGAGAIARAMEGELALLLDDRAQKWFWTAEVFGKDLNMQSANKEFWWLALLGPQIKRDSASTARILFEYLKCLTEKNSTYRDKISDLREVSRNAKSVTIDRFSWNQKMPEDHFTEEILVVSLF